MDEPYTIENTGIVPDMTSTARDCHADVQDLLKHIKHEPLYDHEPCCVTVDTCFEVDVSLAYFGDFIVHNVNQLVQVELCL